jgi:hypothetical protein
MSRAFVREEGDEPDPRRRYPLPPADDPGFRAAAARALLAGADAGDSAGAEEATGYRWGDQRLAGEIRLLKDDAIARGDERMETLADRFLRAAAAGE